MKKSTFRSLCNKSGHNNPVSIEEALIRLLESQKGKEISIPTREFLPEDCDVKDRKTIESCLAEYLQGCDSISVIGNNENDRESYIASLKLNDSGRLFVTVYDYYGGNFRVLGIDRLCDSRDAKRFALEFASFDDENVTDNAGNLTDRQLEALDEFLAAAERLNNEGVSLIWDEEDNSLCAANRDNMRGNDFFRAELDGKVPEDALLLSETATDSLDIEISYMSKDYDLYYLPTEKHKKD